MRSTRPSAAWAALAIATSLLSVTIVSAQTSTLATKGVARGVTVPTTRLYALTSDNSPYILRPGSTQYARGGRVDASDSGNLIGIDFRPADDFRPHVNPDPDAVANSGH